MNYNLGFLLRSVRHTFRITCQLMSSMRFSVSLLILIGLASITGTLIPQELPMTEYLKRFGPYWYGFLNLFGIDHIYTHPYYVSGIIILLCSLSICIFKQTRLYCIKNHAHTFIINWRYLGYFTTHISLLIICLGSAYDGPLLTRWSIWKNNVEALAVDADHYQMKNILPENTYSYHGHIVVRENIPTNIALVRVPQGLVLQNLPFHLTLNEFTTEYYQTGQAKNFKSHVTLTYADKSNEKISISMHEPIERHGITIYQSDVQDSGTTIHNHIHPLTIIEKENQSPEDIVFTCHVGAQCFLKTDRHRYKIWYDEFKEHQWEQIPSTSQAVNNFFSPWPANPPIDLGPRINLHVQDQKTFEITYLEQYLHTISLDNQEWFLLGVLAPHQTKMKFWRIPADSQKSLSTFLQIRQYFLHSSHNSKLLKQFQEQLQVTSLQKQQAIMHMAQMILESFQNNGFTEIATWIPQQFHDQEKQEEASTIFIMILQQLIELSWKNMYPTQEYDIPFLQNTLLAISEGFHYPLSLIIEPMKYQLKLASILQVTRSPCRNIVYGGISLLITGIIIMIFCHQQKSTQKI